MIKKGLLTPLSWLFLVLLLGCYGDESGEKLDAQPTTSQTITEYSLTGKVTCENKPLAGVTVSDGVEVAVTDSNGVYKLRSNKEYGYVFVSTPGGYEAPMNGNAPQFYKRLASSDKDKLENIDFKLNKADNSRHAVFTLADVHLASRNDDIKQFRKAAEDINATIAQLKSQGYKVYGLSLGDESWDLYWYSNRFNIKDVFNEMQRIDAPVYHNMGNHDGNPYRTGDLPSAQSFIDVCGPNYYSFNLGKVHYVVLDNIEYLNDGGDEGKIGRCNYNVEVVAKQMAWLEKDLSLITDPNTPVVVAMHAPLYKHPKLDNGNETHDYLLSNASKLEAMLSRFSNVQVLSGHLHMAHNIQPTKNLIDHNTPALSATWWWTGKLSGNSICTDGTPGGYGGYQWEGTKLDWYYKSLGYDRNYQFRTYDLNATRIDPNTYAPNDPAAMTAFARNYATAQNDNRILINVWNYDPQWKVEATENGKPLKVTRISAYDPLHIISYDAPRIREGGANKVNFATTLTTHMFMVEAATATATVNIRVTDRFGRVYTEDMVRPKALNIAMK